MIEKLISLELGDSEAHGLTRDWGWRRRYARGQRRRGVGRLGIGLVISLAVCEAARAAQLLAKWQHDWEREWMRR